MYCCLITVLIMFLCSSLYKSLLADHCATPPGLRFTPDGYLTGDFNLDMPPMRCVLIDPYTGWVYFIIIIILWSCCYFVSIYRVGK